MTDVNQSNKNKKKEFWWTIEFSISTRAANAEENLSTIAAITEALGSCIFKSNEKLFLRADYDNEDIDEILSNVKKYLDMPEGKGVEISRYYKTENQAWETQHFDAFPPLNVGKSLVVMAPWHNNEKEKISPERQPIYIYPAGAFGTGYHESTQIALTLLEDAVKPGMTVLDVGTGTGILFIAALKLGAAKAIARDIDPDTLDEAKRNINLNGINPQLCEISQGDLLKGFSGHVDILTANILLKPNISLLPDVRGVLNPKGQAIFSGMTATESPEFLSKLQETGLVIEKELKIGDWWGCLAVKS